MLFLLQIGLKRELPCHNVGIFAIYIVAADSPYDAEAHLLVEAYGWGVAHPNLQVAFPCLVEEHVSHGFLHQCVSDALTLMVWQNCNGDDVRFSGNSEQSKVG